MKNRNVGTLLVLSCATVFGLAGCSTLPTPITGSDVVTQSTKDRDAAQMGVEPIQNTLTLEEAIARALKYNLDRRTKMMEEALAFNQYDVSKYDMLPKFMAEAGYSYRDKDAISYQRNSGTGVLDLSPPNISNDREHTTAGLGLTWNLLDFGVSYVTAKQNGDRLLIAGERRRKAMHLLIQDVTAAFWRTASAQKLNEQVRTAILNAESALADSRKAEAEALRSPLDSLKYQRQLLENLKLLEGVEQELASARIELANMMNAPLAADFTVAEPPEAVATKAMTLPVDRLEEVAILQNADLREQYYNVRIAAQEGKKAILRMFPSISLNVFERHDSDSYLVSNHWQEAGAQISFNLFNLLSAPAQMKLAEAGVAVADQRRVATQMALLAQMHIARLQYSYALQQFNRADAIWAVDDKIDMHTANREKAQAQSRLEAVANKTAAILSMLRRYQALSQVHAAAGKLQATLGMEPEIGSVREASLNDLTESVKKSIKDWEEGNLPEAPKPEASANATEAPVVDVAEQAPVSAEPAVATEVKPQEVIKAEDPAPQASAVEPAAAEPELTSLTPEDQQVLAMFEEPKE